MSNQLPAPDFLSIKNVNSPAGTAASAHATAATHTAATAAHAAAASHTTAAAAHATAAAASHCDVAHAVAAHAGTAAVEGIAA